MAKNQSEKIDFRFTGIELISSELYALPQGRISISGFSFDINVNPRVDAASKLVMVGIEVHIKQADNLENKLGKLLAACIYEIINFEDCVIETEPTVFDINDKLLEVLTSVSVSTVRGIMFSQFRGTVLHNAYLPLVDPKTFFKKQKIHE